MRVKGGQLVVTAWHSGSQGGGRGSFGIRFRKEDRSLAVDPGTTQIELRRPGRNDSVRVNVTPSFWRDCPELRHREIGEWLADRKLYPWPKGSPPKLVVTRVSKANVLMVQPLGRRGRKARLRG